MSVVGLIVALLGCLAVQAFFAASEIAMVSADGLKVRAESEGGHERSRVLDQLLANRDRLLALTLTGTNLATVLAAVLLTSFLYRLGPHLVYLAPFILTPITLLLGESIPKLLTLGDPHRFALFAARPLRFLATLLAPLLAAETILSRLLRGLAGVPADAESVFLTREDLSRLLRRRPSDASEHPRARRHPARRAADDQPHLPLLARRRAQGDGSSRSGRRSPRRNHASRPRSKRCAVKDSAACRFSAAASPTSSASYTSSICCAPPISAARSAT